MIRRSGVVLLGLITMVMILAMGATSFAHQPEGDMYPVRDAEPEDLPPGGGGPEEDLSPDDGVGPQDPCQDGWSASSCCGTWVCKRVCWVRRGLFGRCRVVCRTMWVWVPGDGGIVVVRP